MGNPDSDNLNQNSGKDEKTVKSVLPREALINTAVTFLSDKNIQSQDPNLVRRFLIKKGLTENEASIAFQRIEASKTQSLITEYAQPPQRVHHIAPVHLPPPPPSMWHVVHKVVTTITSIGGILYALYWLWKTYISPYLFGRKPKKKPVETLLAEMEAQVECCVTDIRSIRSSMETLTNQKAAELTNGVVVSRIQEVKSEISSLKTLLLNRNQFPATPAPLGTGPLSIPAWQLCTESAHPEHEREGEAEEEGTGSNGTTNGSDSSLEIVKDPNN